MDRSVLVTVLDLSTRIELQTLRETSRQGNAGLSQALPSLRCASIVS